MMRNSFEVVELMSVPGRKDMIAVLKVIAGDIYSVHGTLSCPSLAGNWRVTSVLTSTPTLNDITRVAVGLDGPPGLVPGMLLSDKN